VKPQRAIGHATNSWDRCAEAADLSLHAIVMPQPNPRLEPGTLDLPTLPVDPRPATIVGPSGHGPPQAYLNSLLLPFPTPPTAGFLGRDNTQALTQKSLPPAFNTPIGSPPLHPTMPQDWLPCPSGSRPTQRGSSRSRDLAPPRRLPFTYLALLSQQPSTSPIIPRTKRLPAGLISGATRDRATRPRSTAVPPAVSNPYLQHRSNTPEP